MSSSYGIKPCSLTAPNKVTPSSKTLKLYLLRASSGFLSNVNSTCHTFFISGEIKNLYEFLDQDSFYMIILFADRYSA